MNEIRNYLMNKKDELKKENRSDYEIKNILRSISIQIYRSNIKLLKSDLSHDERLKIESINLYLKLENNL